MLRKLPGVLPLASALLLLLAAGYWMLFSHFAFFDDEGYILLSARSYLEHGRLYTDIYSQYGPCFYVLIDGLHRLTGLAVDHNFARLLTLALWVGCAAFSAALVGRATGERALSLFVLIATFLYLYALSEEPFHPGSLIIFLLAASLYFALGFLRRDAPGGFAVTAGVGAALLALSKINVGLFFLAGLMLWAGLAAGNRPGRRAARPVVLIGLMLCATLLMRRHLGEDWVLIFLAVFGSGLFGLGLTIRPGRDFSARHLGAFALGAGVTAAAVILAVMLRGTTLAGLLEGIVLGPLRHADNYHFPVDWRPGTLLAAFASGLTLLGHAWLKKHDRESAADRLLAAARLVHLAGLLLAVTLLINARVVGTVFSFAIPWLWIWLAPLGGKRADRDGGETKELLCCVVLLQFLHAYPVGGSQESWGTFLVFAIAALAVPETIAWLETGRAASRLRPVLLSVFVLVAGLKAGTVAWLNRSAYAGMTEMGLPGTQGLRLSEREVLVYQTLAVNSVFHSDLLFTLPGMCSFNLWSELPAPTRKNTTLWFALLNESEQLEIIRALERDPGSCLIVQHGLLQILQANGFPPTGPLFAHLMLNYRPAFMLDGFGFWVKKGRRIAPIGTAWDFRSAAGVISFRACVASPGELVEAIDLIAPGDGRTAPAVLDRQNTRVTVQPVNPDGSFRAPAFPAAWPFRLQGLAWISVEVTAPPASKSKPPSYLVLKGPGGKRLGSALFGATP